MNYLLEALCFCAVMSQPHPQVSHATGDIWYTHERLSHGKHLLRLSTTDLIIDWNQARKDRLHVFAEEYANGTCQGRYQLAPATNPSWPKLHATYARQFVFRCI